MKYLLSLILIMSCLPSQAAITFDVRGDSFNARYSSAGKDPFLISNVVARIPKLTTDATAISGSVLDFDDNGTFAIRTAMYTGRSNLPTGQAVSVLMRVKLPYTGFPGTRNTLFNFGLAEPGAAGRSYGDFSMWQNTNGDLYVQQGDDVAVNSLGISAPGITAWAPTSGVWYDLGISFTGTTASNGCKVYLDGVLQNSLTSTIAWLDPRRANATINIGMAHSGDDTTRFKVDEFVVWNSVIDFSQAQTLESGSGMLNGASRTSHVAVAAFDGLASTGAGAANIRSGTTETISGTVVTGTAAIPTASETKHGVSVDATTGTYRGADLWTAVAATDLKHGVTATQDGSVLGTYRGADLWTAVSASDLKHGVAATQDGSVLGTYRGADLWSSVGASSIKLGVSTLQDGTAVPGTLECTDPGQSAVLNGTAYKIYSVNKTGTLSLVTNTTSELALDSAGQDGRIRITRGDAFNLALRVRNADRATFDLSAATMETRFPGHGSPVVIGNAAHTLANQTNSPGSFVVALTAQQTKRMKPGRGQTVTLKATQGSNVLQFRGVHMLDVANP